MDYQTIIVEEKNAVGYLTFNRPKQLNSFNETMHQEVSQTLKLGQRFKYSRGGDFSRRSWFLCRAGFS